MRRKKFVLSGIWKDLRKKFHWNVLLKFVLEKYLSAAFCYSVAINLAQICSVHRVIPKKLTTLVQIPKTYCITKTWRSALDYLAYCHSVFSK